MISRDAHISFKPLHIRTLCKLEFLLGTADVVLNIMNEDVASASGQETLFKMRMASNDTNIQTITVLCPNVNAWLAKREIA